VLRPCLAVESSRSITHLLELFACPFALLRLFEAAKRVVAMVARADHACDSSDARN
jgi:hypothetical protein